MGDATPIISMLAAAIAAMFGFIVWLYKTTLTRCDARVAKLEEREDLTLAALARSIEPIPAMMQSMVEALREIRMTMTYTRSPGERGPS